jgi:dynein heavy chain
VPSDSLNLYILFGNCTGDELETIINGLRNEVKSAGQQDTRDNCWSFFIDRVRKQLKVVLCFSPVGTTLRVRARKFPAIVNCTSIDWFHEWPDEALVSVSSRFLSEVDLIKPEVCCSFMAFVHKSVNDMSHQYLANERRYNYTTPKSFLELSLLQKKPGELIRNMERGLEKLLLPRYVYKNHTGYWCDIWRWMI